MSGGDRLRVLQIGKFYPPHMGGIEIHLQALCEGLQRASVEVKVLAANDGARSCEDVVNGIPVTRVGTLFYVTTVPVCPGMVRRIRAAEADIVHIHWPSPAALVAYLLSGHRGRLVMTYHSDIVQQRRWRRVFWPILRRALDRCAAIIATSRAYIETSPVLEAYSRRCRVIPYGLAVERFRRCETAEVERIRQQYGPRIVLSVGRLIYYKGFEYLVEAMARVQGRLLIIGDGPLRSRLEQQVRDQGIGERVTFLGEIQNQDVAAYYHAADVFVLASVARSEAFGIVQLEAMACGKPIVNTSLASGVPFVSQHGVTGLTVPPKDSAALADAINALLDDPVKRSELGDAGIRRVREEFDFKVMLDRTLRVYGEVMGSEEEQYIDERASS